MKRTHTGFVPEPTAPVEVTDEQRRIVCMAAAVLLDYPGPQWEQALQVVGDQLHLLPVALQERFTTYLQAAYGWGRREMETHYVSCFDQRRRCSPFLSYYAVGDTRQRGAAILAFKESIETLGFTLDRDELPDHVCVLFEVAGQAEGDAHRTACEMLAAHRDGLEVLRLALDNANSPYAELVAAVCATLPAIDDTTRDNFHELIRSGPPAELVGLGTPLPFPTATV